MKFLCLLLLFFLSQARAENMESSPSSPPLATDDPETPGTHGYEINFISDGDKTSSDSSLATGIDAAFGIGEKTQFRISKYFLHIENDVAPIGNGFGSTDAGIKYRFYDQGHWKLGTFPSIDFNDGGLSSEGKSFYLPLIVARDFEMMKAPCTVVINLAYRRNEHPENDSTFVGFSLGQAFNEDSRGMAEFTADCDSHLNLCRNDFRLGLIHTIFPNPSSQYETGLFASAGAGKDADGQTHVMALIGLSLTRKPD